MNEKINYFLKVAASGNISRTAEELHISQPALSYAIHQLEKEWDVKLFERTARGVKLTKIGLRILPYAMEICTKYDGIKKEIALHKANAQSLKIAGGMQHCSLLVGRYMKKSTNQNIFYKQYFDYYDMKAALVGGIVDVVLCGPPITGTNIVSTVLKKEDFGILVSDKNYLSKLQSVTIDEIKPYFVIGQPPESPISIAVYNCVENAEISLKSHIQAENNAIFDLLKGEDSENFVAIYPEYRGRRISQEYPEIKWIRISTEGFYRNIAVSFKKNNTKRVIMDFIQFCEEYYKSAYLVRDINNSDI